MNITFLPNRFTHSFNKISNHLWNKMENLRYLTCIIFIATFSGSLYAQSPTVEQYKTTDQCYIKIYQALTTADARALRATIDTAGYTNINLSTQSGYKLTMADMVLLFRQYSPSADGNHPNGDGTNTTGNAGDYFPSVIPMYTCTTLSLKDADLADECFNSVSGSTDYGNYIGHLMGLTTLTCSKTAKGPDMRGTNVQSTLQSMIIPKLGTSDTADKATATVGMFTGFTALTSIDLNTCAKGDIPANAFQGCTSLSTVKIMTTGLQNIGAYAFQGDTALHKVSFPYGLTTIGNQAFANCDLTQLTFPNTLQTIASQAFLSNVNLKTIKFPASVQSIESGAFNNNKSLDNVYILGENTKAAANAFITNMTCDGFDYNNTYTTDADYQGKFSKNHWRKPDTNTEGTRSPVLLHVPNTETARKRYLNPFIYFIDDSVALEELRAIYVDYGNKTIDYNTFIAQRTTWHDTWSPKYPGNTVDNYVQQIYSYMLARYVDPAKKVEITKSDGTKDSVDYWVTIRPWELDENGNRYPKQDASNQFNAPVSYSENTAYAGWNQFLLAAPDAYSVRDSVKFTTLTDDHWYSMCLPFPMTRAQIDEAFGGATEICEFTKVVKETDGTITFYFTEKATVDASGVATKAHHPYMIHPELKSVDMPAKSASERVIYDANLASAKSMYPSKPTDASNIVKVDFIDKTDSTNVVTHDNAYTFYGNESDSVNIPGNRYFWAWNETQNIGSFFHSSTTMSKDIPWTPYTAIVRPEGTDYVAAAKGNMTMLDWIDAMNEQPTTRIVVIQAQTSETSDNNKVYNINGQYVGDTLTGLPKGLYIVNGKKHLIR
ncbi:MAG: leucine-rich repeat domain-containing protein [Prevotella sp.]|nr:leucine-rich repeat domain-containing protein [Prevotella sp.]